MGHLQYVRGTYDQGISFYDLGPDKRNKLGGKAEDSTCLVVPMLLAHTSTQVHWLSKRHRNIPQSLTDSTVRLIYLHVYDSRATSDTRLYVSSVALFLRRG